MAWLANPVPPSSRQAKEGENTECNHTMKTNTHNGPVAIVTGASSGIGLGFTQALLEHGYRVVATSRTITQSKELKASGDLVLVDGDIGERETAVKVAAAAISR